MTASFTYDGDGNRVEKTVNGTVTRYMVDGNNLTGYAQVVEELDAANAVQVVYTYGLDLISQNRKNTDGWTKSYYGYDATGTTRMLFDESGTVTDTYTYEAFGTIINRTGTTTNAYLFHGEQFDADLGLYYLRARYMDNNIGRFTTMDGWEANIGEIRSANKYGFADSNPVNGSDPSGYVTFMDCAIATACLGIVLRTCYVKWPRQTAVSSGDSVFVSFSGFNPGSHPGMQTLAESISTDFKISSRYFGRFGMGSAMSFIQNSAKGKNKLKVFIAGHSLGGLVAKSLAGCVRSIPNAEVAGLYYVDAVGWSPRCFPGCYAPECALLLDAGVLPYPGSNPENVPSNVKNFGITWQRPKGIDLYGIDQYNLEGNTNVQFDEKQPYSHSAIDEPSSRTHGLIKEAICSII